MDDSHIIELYWKCRPEAISETDRTYSPYCFAIANNILGSREDSEVSW